MPARRAADHDNLLCWQKSGKRLEAETIRDAMLSVSGLLDEQMFGPGTLDEKMRRRSIYFFVKRSQLVPMMTLFDAPDSLARHCIAVDDDGRSAGAVDDEQPDRPRLCRRFCRSACWPARAMGAADNVRRAYAIALGRGPSAEEEADALAFLAEQTQAYAGPRNGPTPASWR